MTLSAGDWQQVGNTRRHQLTEHFSVGLLRLVMQLHYGKKKLGFPRRKSSLLACKVAIRNRCWTADRLQRRGLDSLDSCTFCDQEQETMDHLITKCSFSRESFGSVLGAWSCRCGTNAIWNSSAMVVVHLNKSTYGEAEEDYSSGNCRHAKVVAWA
jgi:hypothetical protein